MFENEQRFLKNLKRDCVNFGSKKYDEILTPFEYLETYPKDVAFYFLRKNIKQICYYGISMSFKYLDKHLPSESEKLVADFVSSCLKNEKKFLGCENFNKAAPLYDVSVLLGSFCSKRSLELFKAINCKYKQLKINECKYHIDAGSPVQTCPLYLNIKLEIKELHKVYFQSGCRLKWRPPYCISKAQLE